MSNSYDLTQLDPNSFENLVNFLAMRVLGNGVTGFAPGSDGGRDGYFEGEAPYPSSKTRWSGVWYIQSKFHKPHLSGDPQKWLARQVLEEIKSFNSPSTVRHVPNVWIIATNIEPSGTPETGAFDKIQKLVKKELGPKIKFDIWGGRKILDFLAADPSAASYFGHFLTPGHVITSLYEQLGDANSQLKSVVEHLVVGQFNEQIYTKLEQAGSSSRPKLHELFVDLPFVSQDSGQPEEILSTLVSSSANTHKISAWSLQRETWLKWCKVPKRSRIILLKGGPGQGKSTAGQYFAQIQRAALILEQGGPFVPPTTRTIAEQFRAVAVSQGFWSETPRIPITIELKDFAGWYGSKTDGDPKGILTYISERISLKTEQKVLTGTMKRALALKSWFINFDGLDEVPNDVKDKVAEEIIKFVDEMLPLIDADVLILCTTRPQGYSGQFDKLDAAVAVLSQLPPPIALACASALVTFDRTRTEAEHSVEVLKSAMQSPQVLELMTTPLQSHIMAVVVRDGGRPPEKRWELFDNFYKVMKKRESQKNFQDPKIAKLLREDDTLLKAIHTRLGVVLHALAEDSRGAETTLDKVEFKALAHKTTSMLIDENITGVVEALMEATTERLVFVNTPESSNTVRFDVRQLQEFFAGEFIYSETSPEEMCSRMEAICTDSHWREVMHFSLSALVVNGRKTELALATKVLTNADNSGNCHLEKIFSKRMATGALLGIRLLNEGVLEQDKRLRQNFLSVLTPIYALPNQSVFRLLTEKKHPNSQSWLLNAMIDHLFEASEGESLGAALALICTLPDDNPRMSDVLEKILNSSKNYLEAIYGALYKSIRKHQSLGIVDDRKQPRQWFVIGTLHFVLSSELRKNFDYSGPVNLLANNAFALASAKEFLRFSVAQTKLIFALLEIGVGNKKSISSPSLTNRQDTYKGMALELFETSWRGGTIPDALQFEVPASEALSPLLMFVYSVILFARDKSYENFKRVRELSIPFGKVSKVLPSSLFTFIPLAPWRRECSDQMSLLSDMTEESFNELIQTGRMGTDLLSVHSESISIEGGYSDVSWENISRDYPNLALEIWMDDIGDRNKQYSKPKFVSCIERIGYNNPDWMGNYILQWGKLFKLLPDKGVALREVFRGASLRTGKEYVSQSEIFPFVLELEKESHWLPILAEMLVAKIPFGDSLNRQHYYRSAFTYLPEKLAEFGLSQAILESFYLNEVQSLEIRRSALALFLAQKFPDGYDARTFFYDNNLDKIVSEFVSCDSPSWFIKSILVFSESYLKHDDLRAIALIGGFSHIFRENYSMSGLIQTLISSWRERSNAPVQSKQLLSRWLETEA
nr:hypothetical protein [uncultured Pseudomonas sp.]